MKKIFLYLLILNLSAAFAHPHVFIDCRYEVFTSSAGIDNIKVQWEFDEFFSESILIDFDVDKDRKLNLQEVRNIYSSAFINTRNYNFFIDMQTNSEKIIIDSVYNFYAFLDDNNLIYEFKFLIPENYNTMNRQITLMSYDPTYYIMVDTDVENPLTIHEDPSIVVISNEKKKDIDFNDYGVLPVNTIELFIVPQYE